MSRFLEAIGLLPSWELPRRPPSRGEQLVLFGIAGTLGLGLCLAFHPGQIAIQHLDSMFYYFIAERAAHGTPPYLSAFSPQTPLGLLLPAAGIYLGRFVGLDAVWASRIVTISAYASTAGMLAVLGHRLSGRRGGALFCTLVFLSFTPLAFDATATGQPKTILVFFVVLTILLVERSAFFLAGMAVAATYLTYQPGLILLPGILAAAAVTSSRPSRQLLRIAVGFVLVVTLMATYLASHGALGEAFVQTHVFMAASRGGRGIEPLSVMRSWRRIWLGGYGSVNVTPIFGVLGLGGVVLLILIHLRRAIGLLQRRPVWIMLVISSVGVGAYAFLDYGGIPDTYLGLAFLTIFAMVFLLTLVEWAERFGWRFAPILVSALIVSWGLYTILTTHARQLRRATEYTLSDQRTAAVAVGNLLTENSVYVLGFPYLLAMNHADNWSIFSSSHSARPGSGYWDYLHPDAAFVPSHGDSLPQIMIISRGKPRGWPEWLHAHYDLAHYPTIEKVGAHVWTRKPR